MLFRSLFSSFLDFTAPGTVVVAVATVAAVIVAAVAAATERRGGLRHWIREESRRASSLSISTSSPVMQ